MKSMKLSLPLALALAAALSAHPADAQKRGHGNGRGHQEQRDDRRERERDRDRDDDRDDDDRYDRDDDHRHERREGRDQPRFERRDSRRDVPRGWCQGRGNPHNTAENCRYNNRSRTWERYDSRTGRYESREQYERRTGGSYGSSGSYDQAHREFHYAHDRQCRERASQRPLDPRWQIQVRSECKAVHDDFHRRWGVRHQ